VTGSVFRGEGLRTRGPCRLSGQSVRKYLPLLIGVPGCLAAGWFELTRALGGREVAWVYVGEWPLYAVVGVYMWWRIWHPPLGGAPGQSEGPPPQTRDGSRLDRGHPDAEPTEDPGLEAWQRYLARLHAADPPGEPPRR
jgi:hypothetical protein